MTEGPDRRCADLGCSGSESRSVVAVGGLQCPVVRSRAAILIVALAGLLGTSSAARADFLTYGYSNARLGDIPGRVGITPRSAPRLRFHWYAKLGGAINGEPVIADAVRVGGHSRNLLVAGTGHGEVVALSADTGEILWRHRVGFIKVKPVKDCGASPDGSFGVFGTLTIDRRAGRVYAVDARGQAWAFALSTGKVVSGWPVKVRGASGDFFWGGLTLSGGSLYVSVASLCDLDRWDGGVVAIDVHRPKRVRRWLTVPSSLGSGGGIWGWGGVSVDDRAGDVYAATGNSIGTGTGTASETLGGSEAVVHLSSKLVVEQINQPLMPPFMIGDRDFGTTPVLLNASDCPPQLVALNKDGELLLYDRNRIHDGPAQRVWVAANSPNALVPLYGLPAFDPATRTLVLVSPSTPITPGLQAGVQALTLTHACRFAVRWWHAFDFPDAGSAPTIAAGVVYIGTGRNGAVRAFRLRDGRLLWSQRLPSTTVFAAPVVDRGNLFLADWSGRVWAFRPRG